MTGHSQPLQTVKKQYWYQVSSGGSGRCHVFPTWQVTEKHRSQTSHQAERTDLFRDTNMVHETVDKTHERGVDCV